MCGRFTTTTSAAAIAAAMEVDECLADLPPRWNVAPTDEVYAVAADVEGARRLGSCRWGLVPGWADDPAIGSRLINARAETVATKPAFRRSFAGGRRCLVPATGWYEWSPVQGGAPRQKQAWHIAAPDGSVLAFAGLWSSWRRDERRIVSCSIVTTAACAGLAALHDRMPVVLQADAWDTWLDPGFDDLDALAALLAAAPPPLDPRPVGPAVGNVANDGPELLDPAEPAEPAGPVQLPW